MPRKAMKKAQKSRSSAKPTTKSFTVGTIAFIGIFLLAYAGLYAEASTQAAILLILAILGVTVAIFNIMAQEEIDFLIAVTSLNVILVSWYMLLGLPKMAKMFLTNLAVAFGAAGLVIALAVIIQLGSRP
jgi:hypothetical protein